MNKKFSSFLKTAMVLGAVWSAWGLPASAKDPLQVPYSETFASGNFSDFVVIDANNDGTTWKYRQNFDDIDAAYIDTQGVSTDDWLILPAVSLDPASLYKLSITLHGTSFNYNECADIFIGNAPTPEAMTKKVVSVVDMFTSRQNPLTESGTFSITDAGNYYIGIHACSGYKRYGIYVLNVDLTVDRAMTTPTHVDNFAVVPDIHGALEGKISLTAPRGSVEGQPLTEPLVIEVMRDGVVAHTVNDVTPGSAVEIAETATQGRHTYRAYARNSCGEGVAVETDAFFGFDLPKAPAAISVKETETLGKVLVNWEPVTEDVNGKILPEGDVTYKLYGPGGAVVVSKLPDTHYTATATRDTQIFANYGVTAISSQGEGEEFIMSDIIPVGNPYSTPWYETFAEGQFSSIIRYDDFGGYMRFGIYSSVETELADADESGYYLIARAYDPGDHARLYTGKINLSGTTYPALTFSYYTIPGCQNTVEVLASDGSEWKSLKTIVTNGDNSQWASALVDLSQYRDKSVQLAFDATVNTHISIALDNFAVTDLPQTDLAVSGFITPETMKIGREGSFEVDVYNKGGVSVPDYSVRLVRNGETIAEQTPATALAPGEKKHFAFTDILPVTAEAMNNYLIEVYAEGETDMSDNVTPVHRILTTQPIYPYVANLKGSVSSTGVSLQWDKPNMNVVTMDMLEPVCESFEDCEDFSIDTCAGWSFIDGDGSKTYYLEDFDFPSQGSEMAAMVLPSSYFSGWKNFESHSGGKMLASFSAVNGPNDDWIISPRLLGWEQTVSFFAKSMSSVYPDAFEFYYSTTGKEKEDFIQLGETQTAPTYWTKYSYDLPDDAVYFAVRYNSGDGFVFMMDDFTFIPLSALNYLNDLVLVGYNVYCDNELFDTLTETKNSINWQNSTDVPQGLHSWSVTALYEQGESRLSNAVTLTSDVQDVCIDGNETVKYFDLQGIEVTNPRAGEIYIEVRGNKATKKKF